MKEASDIIECQITDWAEQKFAEFMNIKDYTPKNKKQLPHQTKKSQDIKMLQPQ